MQILTAYVQNFKSISISGQLTFHKHFNILAGRNNVGKTALLEAISTISQYSLGDNALIEPLDLQKLRKRKLSKGQHSLVIILKLSKSDRRFFFGPSALLNREPPQYLRIHLLMSEDTIEAYRIDVNDRDFFKDDTQIRYQPISTELIQNSALLNSLSMDSIDSEDLLIERFTYAVLLSLKNSMVFISVHRQIASFSSIKPNIDLNSDASNLYTVLYTLRNNEGKIFDDIQKQFILMFPDVKRIHTYIDFNTAEEVSFTRVMLEFDNSSETIPLEECGSGYTQALILLCLIHSKRERIILFDEPHLYLHPHAEKSIYDLAVRNTKNQYIFSTHSPILINYPVEKTIYFVKKEKNISRYVEMTHINEVLDDLGVSNSDFSFSDRVIFVEGPTEENILPLIFEKNGFRQIGFNYKIISLNGTDREFTKRSAMANNSSKLESIFNAISNSPIPYTIMLDKDEKTPEKIRELEETYQGKVVILPRREIENYFLRPEAISALIKKHNPEQEFKIEDIQEFIQNCLDDKDNKTFYPKGCNNQIEDVKASMVLEAVLNTYSMRYNKIRDGLYIAEWLYENGYKELDAIYGFFADFLQGKQLVTNIQELLPLK
ncbi:hypothetical protein COF07_10250 [Bacillus wiedmannii]|uniref:ATP-dependent nuclease n=1 Tax=Bacillus wiedmannii TaxID=1890302 RepID=UPI000BFBF0A2|nr:AAA family ATPase [Bacillus wiedmannii]PHA58716.1 hypothetical protein COF07_10250 [Bacillus wiedmannii]